MSHARAQTPKERVLSGGESTQRRHMQRGRDEQRNCERARLDCPRSHIRTAAVTAPRRLAGTSRRRAPTEKKAAVAAALASFASATHRVDPSASTTTTTRRASDQQRRWTAALEADESRRRRPHERAISHRSVVRWLRARARSLTRLLLHSLARLPSRVRTRLCVRPRRSLR